MKLTGASPRAVDLPEELKVQAGFGQEELIILFEPHLAHGSVLKKTQQNNVNMQELRMVKISIIRTSHERTRQHSA